MSERLDAVFGALSDPTRRRILNMLLEEDLAVSDIAGRFEMTLSAVSKHIRILAEAGLVRRSKRGRTTYCELEPHSLREAMVWMESFGHFEASSLDAIESFLISEMDEVELADPDLDDAEAGPRTVRE